MDYKAYALLGILLASLAAVGASSAAFAQAAAITVSTDKTSYQAGETVTISGKVGTVVSGQSVILQVFNPKGAAYRFDVVSVAADGSYTYPLKVGGPIGITGTYTTTVTYNKQQATTTFMFTAASGGNQTGGWLTATFTPPNGTQMTIQYMITGGSLTHLSGDPATSTLTANVSTTSGTGGMLTLKIPRAVMDAKDSSGKDTDFVVFNDAVQQTTNETTSSSDTTDRTIQIPFEQGTQTIEVVGTFLAVPEFGTVAAIILAVSVVGIIVATTKYTNKFSFLQRF